MTVTLTPELLSDLREKAEALERGDGLLHLTAFQDAANPAVVLALLNRIESLEQMYVRPSIWRCDGCGGRETAEDGRRPDRHDRCGGMWIREA